MKTKHSRERKYVHSPIFTMPWFVSSQQDCKRNILKLWLCFGEKYPNAASVTW